MCGRQAWMPSHPHPETLCVGQASPSHALKPLLDACLSGSAKYIFQGFFSHKGFSAGIVVFPFFPTITMLDHHYTNGGALAFQGASIKEGKKSCSQRGEIHFVPGSNICCSRPSQKDAGIKPKSPLIYCNDRQTDRQAERMTICGSEGEKGKDKNNFCLTVCHFLVLSVCMCQRHWW